ncbi:hypothetical protein B9Z55_022022 [Caenorhabditis nigoni]|uniref:Retrotransposon gag domain-containing protein n=2 Tax=Caenorhabditis nigoni TaxID=1611254 RepID=A0A2G5TUM0_9PELO|nr:hypothetical protein B9Z55_022022 [Caenorhabditis nigoni]
MMRICKPWFLSPFASNALCLPDEQRTSKSILYRCKSRRGGQRGEPKLRGTQREGRTNGKVEPKNHEVTREKEDIQAKSCKQTEQLIKETKYPGIERRERLRPRSLLGSSFATIFFQAPRPNPSSESPRKVPGLCRQASKPLSLQAVSRSCTTTQTAKDPIHHRKREEDWKRKKEKVQETLQRKEEIVAKLKALFGRRRGTRTSPVRTRSRTRREHANLPRTSSPIPGRNPPHLAEPESSDEEETTIIPRNQTFTPNQTLQMNREALEAEIEELARTMQARETQLAALNQTIIRQPTPRNEVATTPRNKPTSQIPTWKQKADLAKTLDPRIKKFSEGRSSDLFRWLEEYSKTLFRLEIPRKIGTEMLPFFLSGTALIKYNSIDEAITHDWVKVTQQLMKLHDCPADRELSRQELTSTKQGKRSVTAFADHIRKQGEYCYQGIAPQVRDGLLVSHFINGCSKEIKTRLRQLQKQPKDLAETIAEAEKIQRLIQLEEEEEDTIDGLEAQINQLRFQQTQDWQPTGGRGGYFSRGNYSNESNGENYQNSGGNQNPDWFQNDNPQERFQNNASSPENRVRENSNERNSNESNVSATQICGFGETGNVFIPPTPTLYKFDADLRRLQNALDECSIHQGYRTEDGYIIEFPDVQGKGWNPDMHIDPSMTGKLPEYWFRRTRDTVTMLGAAGTTFSVDIGEPFFTPIVRRLFAATNIDQLTELKNPNTDPDIRKEFGKYGVTNKLLSDRDQRQLHFRVETRVNQSPNDTELPRESPFSSAGSLGKLPSNMEKEFLVESNNERTRVLQSNNCNLAISEAPADKSILETEAEDKSSN